MIRFPFRFALFASGLLALAPFGSQATAQRDPVPAPKKQPTEPDAEKGKKTTGKVVTYDSLAEMLDTMGYEFKTQTYPEGDSVFWITTKADTWTFVVGVTLSVNKGWVWLNAPLRDIPAGGVPSEPLVRLLQKNWSISPHVFSVTQGRTIYLQRTFENQNITPAKLRNAIEGMTSVIRSTTDLWNVEKWGQTPETKKGGDGGTAAYPDTPEGLTKLTKEIAALAKAGKRAEVAAKVKGFIIPNHDAWFKQTFGADVGTALSEEYTAGLPQLEAGLVRSFMTAAEEGQTDVKVFKFTQADQEGITAAQKKVLAAMVVKAPLYSVYLAQPDEDTGMHLYSFVFVDGNFRMAGKMKAMAARTSGFRPNNGDGINPAKLEGTSITFPLFSGAAPGTEAPGFSTPGNPLAVNELNPNNFRHLSSLVSGEMRGPNAFAAKPLNKPEAEADEPSIVGTWKGELNLGPQRWKVTTTFRTDGTYKTAMIYADYVMADKGTYTYSDGILKTEPEGGLSGTFSVTFVGDDTMKLRGAGLSITYKRQ